MNNLVYIKCTVSSDDDICGRKCVSLCACVYGDCVAGRKFKLQHQLCVCWRSFLGFLKCQFAPIVFVVFRYFISVCLCLVVVAWWS